MARNDEARIGGWHTRLWRRVRSAPGVTINLYEGLAHHHPGPAKAVAAMVVGLTAIATAAIIAIGVATIGALLLGVTTGGTSRRSKRR